MSHLQLGRFEVAPSIALANRRYVISALFSLKSITNSTRLLYHLIPTCTLGLMDLQGVRKFNWRAKMTQMNPNEHFLGMLVSLLRYH